MSIAFGRSGFISDYSAIKQSITLSSGVAASSGPGKLVLTSESGTSDQLDKITGLTEGQKVTIMAATGHTITIQKGSFIKLRYNIFTLSGYGIMELASNGSDVCIELTRSTNT